MSVQLLINTMLDEAELIDELLDAAIQQRESVKNGQHVIFQELIKSVQNISFRIQAQENRRAKLTEKLSKEFNCIPNLSALSQVIPEDMRVLFVGAGERLGHAVFALKSEMAILQGLIEHNERFSAMLISEWQRLEGNFSGSSRGLDFRG